MSSLISLDALWSNVALKSTTEFSIFNEARVTVPSCPGEPVPPHAPVLHPQGAPALCPPMPALPLRFVCLSFGCYFSGSFCSSKPRHQQEWQHGFHTLVFRGTADFCEIQHNQGGILPHQEEMVRFQKDFTRHFSTLAWSSTTTDSTVSLFFSLLPSYFCLLSHWEQCFIQVWGEELDFLSIFMYKFMHYFLYRFCNWDHEYIYIYIYDILLTWSCFCYDIVGSFSWQWS